MTRLHARISLHNETFFYLIARIYFFGKCIAQQKKIICLDRPREKKICKSFLLPRCYKFFAPSQKLLKFYPKTLFFASFNVRVDSLIRVRSIYESREG
jgi:hypothetical protein